MADWQQLRRPTFIISAFILAAVSAFLAWQSIIGSEQHLSIAQYQKLLSTTAENVLAPASDDASLRLYGVYVVRTPPLKGPNVGFGVYLGGGHILTAAHVIGHWPAFTNLRVFIAGRDIPVTVEKKGSFARTDLALLTLDPDLLPVSLRLRRNPLCDHILQVGSSVIIAYPDRTSRSHIISPLQIPSANRAALSTGLINEPQGSGAGVYDSETKCLLGIVSGEVRKEPYRGPNGNIVPVTGYAGFFVSTAKIVEFLRDP